jgi:DNA-binding transcriptional ArsR family regulator
VPAIEELDPGALFAALADPLRRRVVVELARGERVDSRGERSCASFELPVAKSTRTYHWRVLREGGLIRQRDVGNGTFVRLRREELEQRFPGLVKAIAHIGADPSDSAGRAP